MREITFEKKLQNILSKHAVDFTLSSLPNWKFCCPDFLCEKINLNITLFTQILMNSKSVKLLKKAFSLWIPVFNLMKAKILIVKPSSATSVILQFSSSNSKVPFLIIPSKINFSNEELTKKNLSVSNEAKAIIYDETGCPHIIMEVVEICDPKYEILLKPIICSLAEKVSFELKQIGFEKKIHLMEYVDKNCQKGIIIDLNGKILKKPMNNELYRKFIEKDSRNTLKRSPIYYNEELIGFLYEEQSVHKDFFYYGTPSKNERVTQISSTS